MSWLIPLRMLFPLWVRFLSESPDRPRVYAASYGDPAMLRVHNAILRKSLRGVRHPIEKRHPSNPQKENPIGGPVILPWHPKHPLAVSVAACVAQQGSVFWERLTP